MNHNMNKIILTSLFLILGTAACAESESITEAPLEMNTDLMEKIVSRLDEGYQRQENFIVFNYADLDVTIVTDENANRMRVMIPVAETDGITEAMLIRIMQANFDSALDARYAIGQGILWGTFIHPMASLSPEDFLSGIGQTINIVKTFGTSFSSGAMTFGGGDSAELHRELIDELLKRGQAI